MNKNKYGNIIKKKIENIRGKNNINWMNILRLAFELDQKERKNHAKGINNDDKKISKTIKKIIKIENEKNSLRWSIFR